MRQCQLMRWTATGPRGGRRAPPIQEIRSVVVWAVLYSGLDECVCSTAMWMLCVNCGGQSAPG